MVFLLSFYPVGNWISLKRFCFEEGKPSIICLTVLTKKLKKKKEKITKKFQMNLGLEFFMFSVALSAVNRPVA